LEQRNGLSFLREPDPGFVWAAYRWVRGAKLEDVLDSVPGLTPGDFVRSMKQLIDLLDQIAIASKDLSADGTRRKAKGAAAGQAPASDSIPATSGEGTAGADRAEGPDSDENGDERPSREPAPKNRGVAATARAAIDAMRRGVVEYTTLTD
jgi:ATP-dependent RNA helicase HelY